MKTHNRSIHSDVDYSGVYGGPPTRALFYEARRAFALGEKDYIEIPVFGDRVLPDASFFGDIFKPGRCFSSDPSNGLSSGDGAREDVNSKHCSFSLFGGNHFEGDGSFRRNRGNLDDKESESTSSSEDAAETKDRVPLSSLLRTESGDKGKVQGGSSFHGWLKAESMRKLLPRVTTRERHFHSFNSDFFCSSGLVSDAHKEDDNSNLEGSFREMLKQVKNKVLDGLSKTKPIPSRKSTNRKTIRNSAMNCRFSDDVSNDDGNSNISEKTKKTGKETIKTASSIETRVESNSHSTSKVSDSSISADKRRSNSPILTTMFEAASDYDSDQSLFIVKELADYGGQETEEMKIAEKVRSWSKGKEGNIRSLLSTLQFILWAGSGWSPVRLVDIIEGSAVKKSYQKALLCLHPDKLQQKGALGAEKVTAQMVFDILQEAWSHFNTIGLC